MRHYIGIDLGTTNSAICTFDGTETRVWKSPEQSDVTPSAIYIDKRGHRFFGRRALEMAASAEQNSATLFKRFMGTNQVFELKDSGITLTPVECSAELLKAMFSYLPEEIREDPETAAVITVPAAFNQMKKDATLEAAGKAGIANVALMQEPVAAVMSVLRKDPGEKLFLVYDLGGGTFDVSVARHISGHVSLLAQGGREMCGGRDEDRWIYRNRILPWLSEHFSLPADPEEQEKYRSMKRAALFAAEQAKIELASAEETTVWLDERALHTEDENGEEMYLDVSLTREDLVPIIHQMADTTAEITRETMRKAGVAAEKIDEIVFIGGPTMYEPFRRAVCERLGISRGVAVNPMTAVAEGASIYAESIDWESAAHGRRERFEELSENEQIRIRCEARTSSPRGKIAILSADHERRIAQVTAADGSFDSGPVNVVGQAVVSVPLDSPGIHSFRLTVRDADGQECLEPQMIEITRTLASLQQVPASHSVAVKALDRPGGTPVPVYLVEENEPLPKSGSLTFRAADRLVGGSSGALVFSLWEGEIPDPVDDNRYIGTFRIPGTAFQDGTVEVGAEVICDYEMNESGTLRLGVSIPDVGLRMKDRNFYSRYEGQRDYTDVSGLVKEINELLERTAQMKRHIADAQIGEVRDRLLGYRSTLAATTDPEEIAEVENGLLDCYRAVSDLHQRYRNVMQSRDLDQAVSEFEEYAGHATDDEKASFENLTEAARFSIDMGSPDFENQLQEMKRRTSEIRWKDDGFIRRVFASYTLFPGAFSDRAAYDRLRAEGLTCLENGDIDGVRQVLLRLMEIRVERPDINVGSMFEAVNIYR